MRSELLQLAIFVVTNNAAVFKIIQKIRLLTNRIIYRLTFTKKSFYDIWSIEWSGENNENYYHFSRKPKLNFKLSLFFKLLFFLISSTIRSNVQHYQNSYTLSILPSRGNTYKKIKHFSSTKQKRISEKVTRTYSNLGTSLRTNIWKRGEGRGTRGERFSAAGGGVLLCERADLWTLSQP